MAGDDCIFCKIVAGKIPATKIFEDDRALILKNQRRGNPARGYLAEDAVVIRHDS